MTGTVTYTATLPAANQDIYDGVAAKTFPVSQSGAFPDNYTVISAQVTYDVRVPGWNTDGSGREIQVYGDGALLGTAPCGNKGSQSAALSTGASYEGLQSIRFDGGRYWACQLQGGSTITLTVTWDDNVPEEIAPPDEDPLNKPIDVVTGTIRSGGDSAQAMYTEPIVAFEGVDISDEIRKYLLSFSFTDNEEDETDDLQLKLQDARGLWLKKWLNASLQAAISGGEITLGGKSKGLKISAGIRCHYPGGITRQTNCGSFTLDSIRGSGPPSTITVKSTSLPYAAGVRTEKRDKAWESYTLSGIGAEIAGRAGLGFMFDASGDPFYTRLEQMQETDIAFLQRLCHDAGYALKVSDSRLIVFDPKKYEALAAVLTITWQDGSYTKYDLSTTEGDVTFAQCEVRWYNPETKETIIGTANADNFDAEDENNQTLVITDHAVENAGEASALAVKLLRLHNKFEREISFTLVGNPLLAAGLTVEITGFGLWDGKYLLKQVKHSISRSGGYTTQFKARCVYAHQVTKTGAQEETAQQSGGGSSSSGTKRTGTPYYVLAYTATLFSDQAHKNSVGSRPAGTELTIMGSSSGGYTLVSAGGLSGYVSTGAIKTEYR